MQKGEPISTSPIVEKLEGRRRLPAFMTENIRPIVVEWENFANVDADI